MPVVEDLVRERNSSSSGGVDGLFGAHLPVGAVVHLVELVDVVLLTERLEELLGAAACGEDEGVGSANRTQRDAVFAVAIARTACSSGSRFVLTHSTGSSSVVAYEGDLVSREMLGDDEVTRERDGPLRRRRCGSCAERWRFRLQSWPTWFRVL